MLHVASSDTAIGAVLSCFYHMQRLEHVDESLSEKCFFRHQEKPIPDGIKRVEPCDVHRARPTECGLPGRPTIQ